MYKYFSAVLFVMLSVGVIGCEKQRTISFIEYKNLPVNNKITLKADAPDNVYLSTKHQTELPISMQLENISTKAINLMESTPCSVFRWYIVDEQDKIIQSKPNKLCVQSVASFILNPNKYIERSYKIKLHSSHYVVNSRYRLVYKFWKYAYYHDFVIKK